MAQYISLVETNQELTKQVRDKVNEFNALTDGDKLVIAGAIVEKSKKQDICMDIMGTMLKSKTLEIEAYEAKLGRKLSSDEVARWVNGQDVPAVLDDIDRELLNECRLLTGKPIKQQKPQEETRLFFAKR